jgi:NAD(P)-dependent dehydrogenase (short-subunit alcohol dehydrogenase family)
LFAVVLTGASVNGLGAHTVIALANSQPPPARLVLLARSASKVQPVIDTIKSINPSIEATFVSISLDSLASVRKAAEETLSKLGSDGKIDILINNAGIMATPFSKTEDGFENQFATNHLGHFQLTKSLWPAIKAAGPQARVINVTSVGYKISPFRPDDYNFGDGSDYDEWSGYGQSKTANILFTKGLAARGVTSFAVHPGTIMTTNLSTGMDMSLFGLVDGISRKNTGEGFTIDPVKSVDQGIATAVVAVVDPRIVPESGNYFANCQVEDVKEYAKDPVQVQKLWDLSETLIGEKFEI